MKSFLIAIATAFFPDQIRAKGLGQFELTDTFTDMVQSISEEGKALIVRFYRHSAQYQVETDHPQFREIKAKLEKAKKIDQKLKVIAIIPSMMIKEIRI